MVFLVILLVIFFLSTVALGYGAWNMIRKNERLEDFVNNAFDEATQTLANMRALDQREMFESDDEVGQIFQQLVKAVHDYAVFLGVEPPTEEKNAT